MAYPSVKPLCFDKSVALTCLIDPANVAYDKPSAYTTQFKVGGGAPGAYKGHSGLDLSTTHKYPVRSCFDGKVTARTSNASSGNYITVTDNSGRVLMSYCHLDSFSVALGTVIKKGQEIGKQGTTGNSTGSHVHIAMFVDGKRADPYDYVIGGRAFPYANAAAPASPPAPVPAGGVKYTVVSGDTLSKIAAKFSTTIDAIFYANQPRIQDRNKIQAGWVLTIPGYGLTSAAPSVPAQAKKTNVEIAKEVIQGKWGNGADRKTRLSAAGYDPAAIQALVNKMLK